MAVYGIDLGTTYSCIAKLDRNGNPEVIRNQADNSDTLASAVFFESADNVIIGNSAKDMVETDGDRVVQFVKREIGKETAQTRVFFDKSYTPVEISALILKRLKQIAEEQGETVEQVVITCPAYFGLEERNATRSAGELAGLTVLNLINEPTAAALSYCARQFQEERTIMVYDLGGGTFDVTIIKMSMEKNADGNEVQKVRVVATGGNDLLGGADWDQRLYDYMLQACCDENGLTPDDIEPDTKQLIRSKVESVKQKLTNAETAKARINVNGTVSNVEVTRETFESLTTDLVAQTINYVEDTLQKAGNKDIDMVLLVGGSTFMPMIRKAVEDRFPGKVQIHEPNRAVAMGAAIYASMLVEEEEVKDEIVPPVAPGGEENNDEFGGVVGKMEQSATTKRAGSSVPTIDIDDQLPRSFGPGVLNRQREYIIDNLLLKDGDMPGECTRTYYTSEDYAQRLILRAFESMCKDATLTPCVDEYGDPQPTEPSHQVKLLGELEMTLPPQTMKGTPIEVTFRVDASGVYITAINSQTGEKVETKLSMGSDVDMESSAANNLTVAGE